MRDQKRLPIHRVVFWVWNPSLSVNSSSLWDLLGYLQGGDRRTRYPALQGLFVSSQIFLGQEEERVV